MSFFKKDTIYLDIQVRLPGDTKLYYRQEGGPVYLGRLCLFLKNRISVDPGTSLPLFLTKATFFVISILQNKKVTSDDGFGPLPNSRLSAMELMGASRDGLVLNFEKVPLEVLTKLFVYESQFPNESEDTLKNSFTAKFLNSIGGDIYRCFWRLKNMDPKSPQKEVFFRWFESFSLPNLGTDSNKEKVFLNAVRHSLFRVLNSPHPPKPEYFDIDFFLSVFLGFFILVSRFTKTVKDASEEIERLFRDFSNEFEPGNKVISLKNFLLCVKRILGEKSLETSSISSITLENVFLALKDHLDEEDSKVKNVFDRVEEFRSSLEPIQNRLKFLDANETNQNHFDLANAPVNKIAHAIFDFPRLIADFLKSLPS